MVDKACTHYANYVQAPFATTAIPLDEDHDDVLDPLFNEDERELREGKRKEKRYRDELRRQSLSKKAKAQRERESTLADERRRLRAVLQAEQEAEDRERREAE